MTNTDTRYSIIGSGYFVKIFDKSHPLYKQIVTINLTHFSNTLFNSDSFSKLNLENEGGCKYKTFQDVIPSSTFVVYALDYYTRLEIKRDKQKVIKLFFRDLIRNDFLFPPEFDVNKVEFKNNALLIFEFDKGNFGSTKLSALFDKSDKISFELIYFTEQMQFFVKSITINECELKFKKLDTLNFGYSVHVA